MTQLKSADPQQTAAALSVGQLPLKAPPWLGAVDDLEDAPTRILLAAAELFGQRSPARVSLRAIAARAEVNYGLIHHYFKTKEAILAELLRRASSTGAARMRDSQSIVEALGRLVGNSDFTNYGSMLAWAMLEETDPQELPTASPAIALITSLIAQQLGDHAELDPKIVAAVTVSALLGWRLYHPFITVAAELQDRDEHELTVDVLKAIQSIIGSIGRR